ncbi:hypothetical protein BESB_012620 [Besnoitia besnoiti]|uniref:SAYSvFN domain-containing protein n=1 Tax=Besnoitia besnoiti TaxID=94643 RepID=A0A2A9MB91_BESBE|nr:hypothetical protein BESB_012620 [Besnoitia besnoiti]PFH32650.1 hypothetical protein BESB_012620 [Besnoitia besnoiti]
MERNRIADDEDDFSLAEIFSKEQLTALCTWKNGMRLLATVCTILATRRFGALAGILIGFALILWNLRYDEAGGAVSAYSVFNRGVRHLLGDLRPADVDRQLRNGDRNGDEQDDDNVVLLDAPRAVGVHRSRDANKRCPCGSGKKTKKCCGRDFPDQD